MTIGGWKWASRALPAVLAMTLAGPVWGQPGGPGAPAKADVPGIGAGAPLTAPASSQPAPPPPVQSDALSPMHFMNGPSLHETGRIAVAPPPTPMALIENEGMPKSPNEKSIVPAAATLGVAPVVRRPGVIDQRVLDREINEHFADISGCRVEVARNRQVMPPQIVADRLLLRWMIQPDGTIGTTEVVAVAPVDLAVMDCAKRVMSQWTFTRPRGGPVAVERPFTF